jgi:hypothetical protein
MAGGFSEMNFGDRVATEKDALRRIRRSWIKGSGQIQSVAFEPRANGNDRDGLSVSIAGDGHRELHRQLFESDSLTACAVVAGGVREIGLDVLHAPEADNPTHALITGIPDRTQGDGENLAAAKHCARRLSSIARPYSFD